MVDEVEQCLVRPVQVLDDDDQRALLGELLEEATPGGKRLVASVSADVLLDGQSHERSQVRPYPGIVGGCLQLFLGLERRIGLEDARLCLDDLAQCPEGDSVPVRETAALPPGDELGISLDGLEELEDQPRLADSGDADERNQLRQPLLPSTGQRALEQGELVRAADEGGAVEAVERDPSAGRQRLPDEHRPRLPLCFYWFPLLVLDGGPRRPEGRLSD